MADSAAFACLCDFLETATNFDRLEARGTVRLTLKQAGLDPHAVTASQMQIVVEQLLAAELTARGVEDAESICARAIPELAALGDEGTDSNSPEAIFSRLGGD